MRNMSAKFGLLLAAVCLSLPMAAATPGTSFAATSADCIKAYAALKKNSDVQRAKAKKQKMPVDQLNKEINSRLKAKAQECVKIARTEAENFLDEPLTLYFSIREKSFNDACELVGDGADIECWVVPAYRQCVERFSYSPDRCQKLNGITAQPCCNRKR